ncbi:MAG: SDR family NAD(P)-dependent oxidoreductase [Flavobacteriales bacterium AspAUS03]
MRKKTFITGATAGIGEACAERFAQGGYDLILSGRREDRLEKLKQRLEENYEVRIKTLCFDIRDRTAVFCAVVSLETEWQSIDVLVNNAGLALGMDLFPVTDLADWDAMIDTNVKGFLYVTKAILPRMIDRKKGHIINIGSISGKDVYEKASIYCATKHAVDALNKALRIDLLKYRIKVTAINPGATETEFSQVRFRGDTQRAKSVYEGYQPLNPTDVADVIYYTTTLPEHVCINDLVVTPLAEANIFYLNKDR